MSWLQVYLPVAREQAPLIELVLEQLGALSVTLEDAGDEPMFEPAPGETPIWHATRVCGLFDGATDPETLRGRLDQLLDPALTAGLELQRLADQAWERAWLAHFRPLSFGDGRLWICPGDQQPADPDPAAVQVRLDPGLAFGTGTHPTTALCLDWLARHPPAGQRVLDVGCGSGILAVVAARLGATRIRAIDHDPQALLATAANARLNGLAEDAIDTALALDEADTGFDLVLANILANVLIDLAPRLATTPRPGGRLILSGILPEQAAAVRSAYEAQGLVFEPTQTQDGWVRLDGRR